MSGKLNMILSAIEAQNPLHSKKLRSNLTRLEEEYFERAEIFFSDYNNLLSLNGRDLNYAIDCYLKMLSDFVYEQIKFFQTGCYSNHSFEEVNTSLYNNPEKCEYYMHGLLLTQFLWLHHYKIFSFFHNNISTYGKYAKSYLEIGGGHGLYLKEALTKIEKNHHFDMLDISPTSIAIAKKFINSDKVNYITSNIFDYSPDFKYSFVSMCEVLEHVEDPLSLLLKLKRLLSKDGTAYITTPTNAPTIDHIYLFNNSEEIRELISKAGFKVEKEIEIPTENISVKEAHNKKICVMYGAFITLKDH